MSLWKNAGVVVGFGFFSSKSNQIFFGVEGSVFKVIKIMNDLG